MMSLIKTNVFEISKIQYSFKLKTYFELLFKLAIIQMIGIFFSTNKTSMFGLNHISIYTFSNDAVILFTLIWAFTIAITLTTTNYKNMDFTFVSNRLSSNLSDIGFLATCSLLGGITASLSSVFLRVLFYFTQSNNSIIEENFFTSQEF